MNKKLDTGNLGETVSLCHWLFGGLSLLLELICAACHAPVQTTINALSDWKSVSIPSIPGLPLVVSNTCLFTSSQIGAPRPLTGSVGLFYGDKFLLKLVQKLDNKLRWVHMYKKTPKYGKPHPRLEIHEWEQGEIREFWSQACLPAAHFQREKLFVTFNQILSPLTVSEVSYEVGLKSTQAWWKPMLHKMSILRQLPHPFPPPYSYSPFSHTPRFSLNAASGQFEIVSCK